MTATFRTMYADIMAESTKVLEIQEKKLAGNPKDADAWYARGSTLVKLGHYREALASFELAMEIDSKFGGTWIEKADVHQKLGEIRLAAECYPKMISPVGVLTLIPKKAAWVKDLDMTDVTNDELTAFEQELSEPVINASGSSIETSAVEPVTEKEIDVTSMDEVALYTFLSESATHLKPLLVIAKNQSIDISEGRRLISDVVILGKQKESRKAVSTMILGMKSIRGAINQKFLTKITMMENEVTKLQNAWDNVAKAHKLILLSKDLLTAGDYQTMQKNLEDARLVIEPLKLALARAEDRTDSLVAKLDVPQEIVV